MSSQGYPSVPITLPDPKEHNRQIVSALNGHNQGKFNCTIDVVVTASDVVTVVEDPRITVFSFLSVMAFDANGAADIAAGIYWDAINTGTATMNHRSDASVRSLRVLILQ